MVARLRGVAALAVVLTVGVLAGSAIAQWREGSGPVVGTPRFPARGGARVRVEVLNGGGRAGAAREATERLRDGGFDVVYFGNAASFGRDSSVVLDRIGAMEPARAVADALGIRNVRSEPDSNLYLDVSVVLGADWKPSIPGSTPVRDPPHRSWWDPRGWLRRRRRGPASNERKV
jgi:hypothetical protein